MIFTHNYYNISIVPLTFVTTLKIIVTNFRIQHKNLFKKKSGKFLVQNDFMIEVMFLNAIFFHSSSDQR